MEIGSRRETVSDRLDPFWTGTADNQLPTKPSHSSLFPAVVANGWQGLGGTERLAAPARGVQLRIDRSFRFARSCADRLEATFLRPRRSVRPSDGDTGEAHAPEAPGAVRRPTKKPTANISARRVTARIQRTVALLWRSCPENLDVRTIPVRPAPPPPLRRYTARMPDGWRIKQPSGAENIILAKKDTEFEAIGVADVEDRIRAEFRPWSRRRWRLLPSRSANRHPSGWLRSELASPEPVRILRQSGAPGVPLLDRDRSP